MLSPPSIEPIISSEYDTILEEVQDLNLQLHRKSSVNVDLTKEKEGLVSELEKCREELNISRIKIAKSKEALAGQLKSTCLREKNLSTLESTWRCSMERERKEIEALRSDLIRVESSGSEEKLETLQYEMRELKRVHHEAIKEHVMDKVRHETVIKNALRNAETANEGRENDASVFAETIQNLFHENSESSSKLITLQSELRECQLRMKQIAKFESQLRTELRQEHQSKNQREAEIVHTESSFAIKFKNLQSKNALLDTELHGLHSTVTVFKQDLVSSKLQLKETSDELRRSEELLARTEKESIARNRRIQCMKEEMAMEKERLVSSIESLDSNIKESKIKFQHDMKEVRDCFEEKEAALHQHQRDLVSAKEKADRQHQSALHSLEIENMSLTKNASSLQNDLSIANVETQESIGSLKQSVALCQHELNKALKDCRVLAGQNSALENTMKETTQQYLAMQTNLDSTTDECSKMRSELVEKGDRFNDLSMQNEVLSSQLRAQSKELLSERNAKENSLEESRISKVMVEKEKKKCNAYKQKALEAHAKNILLKSMPKESNTY